MSAPQFTEVVSLFFSLTKPTISLFVVITTVPIMFTFSVQPSVLTVLHTALGVYLAASAAGVLNQVVDRRIDATMERTSDRVIPSHKLSTVHALIFGLSLSIVSFFILWLLVNPLTAFTSLAANLFYVLFYTSFLKLRTDQNIVIGGAAGSVGPLLGCSAVMNDLAHWSAWAQFLLIFLWTPPHFWALSIKYTKDYARAGVPMLPVTRGEKVTRRSIWNYSLSLVPSSLAVCYFGDVAPLTWIAISALTLVFLYLAFLVLRERSGQTRRSMQLFVYSCFYVLLTFSAIGIDALLMSA